MATHARGMVRKGTDTVEAAAWLKDEDGKGELEKSNPSVVPRRDSSGNLDARSVAIVAIHK